MQHIASNLRVKADRIDKYDEAHRRVWPALLQKQERLGIRDCSILRRDPQLLLTMHLPDFEEVTARRAQSEVNSQWRHQGAPLFEDVPGMESGEPFAMMRGGFFMSRSTPSGDSKQARRQAE